MHDRKPPIPSSWWWLNGPEAEPDMVLPCADSPGRLETLVTQEEAQLIALCCLSNPVRTQPNILGLPIMPLLDVMVFSNPTVGVSICVVLCLWRLHQLCCCYAYQ